MIELEQKYYHQDITSDELLRLREKVNASSDEEIGQQMYEQWMDDSVQPNAEDRLPEEVWERIQEKVGIKTVNPWHKVWRWMQVAAVIMLPVLLATNFWMYDKKNSLQTSETTISTSSGERSNVVLPDGTKIILNENSALSYSAKDFNRAKREITFYGEAFFEVAKDSLHPFGISSEGLNVQVLGTAFNLYTRKGETVARIALQRGKVMFTSTTSQDRAIVLPNQIATLDKSTGSISVTTASDMVKDATAWQRHELVFRNATLRQVLATIEKNYGVSFRFRTPVDMSDLFTGVLSADNLSENLKILEQSYHLKTEVHDTVVTVRR